ncbi:MAG: low molecular weight phosphotyrosine protein phosphatase [Flavobacteriales bacterium]|nr:low molecular weight phosphotyrosine protein phosphatase [Flavobacteriales bacterium]
MLRILMVCLGNICRSPLAEGLLKSKLDTSKYFVDSAGTGSWHIGHQPDKRSIAVADKHNLDISDQRGRQFSEVDFDNFDIIYAMDINNYEDLREMAKSDKDTQKVKLLLDILFPGENMDVPDPYTGGMFQFEQVYDILDKATTQLANQLNND